jgi:hypothetical protein
MHWLLMTVSVLCVDYIVKPLKIFHGKI